MHQLLLVDTHGRTDTTTYGRPRSPASTVEPAQRIWSFSTSLGHASLHHEYQWSMCDAACIMCLSLEVSGLSASLLGGNPVSVVPKPDGHLIILFKERTHRGLCPWKASYRWRSSFKSEQSQTIVPGPGLASWCWQCAHDMSRVLGGKTGPCGDVMLEESGERHPIAVLV